MQKETQYSVAALLSFVVGFGVPLNAITMYIFYFKLPRSTFHILITGLTMYDLLNCGVTALADLLSATVLDRRGMKVSCRIFSFFGLTNVTSTYFVLFSIALHRYRGILHPFGWKISPSTAKLIACVAPLFGVPDAILGAIITEGMEVVATNTTQVLDCQIHPDYAGDSIAIAFFAILCCMSGVSTLGITAQYACCIKALWKRSLVTPQSMAASRAPNSQPPGSLSTNQTSDGLPEVNNIVADALEDQGPPRESIFATSASLRRKTPGIPALVPDNDDSSPSFEKLKLKEMSKKKDRSLPAEEAPTKTTAGPQRLAGSGGADMGVVEKRSSTHLPNTIPAEIYCNDEYIVHDNIKREETFAALSQVMETADSQISRISDKAEEGLNKSDVSSSSAKHFSSRTAPADTGDKTTSQASPASCAVPAVAQGGRQVRRSNVLREESSSPGESVSGTRGRSLDESRDKTQSTSQEDQNQGNGAHTRGKGGQTRGSGAQNRAAQGVNPGTARPPQISNLGKMRRNVFMMLTVLFCFLVSFVPATAVSPVFIGLLPDGVNVQLGSPGSSLLMRTFYFSSLVNPFIYSAFDAGFRSQVVSLFKSCRRL